MALIEISVWNFEGNYLSKSGETQINSCTICNGEVLFDLCLPVPAVVRFN